MTEITITNNRASRAIVGLHPVPAVQDLHHLQISSQWLGVKAPQGLHSMISLCPDTADLRALHAWLGTYLQVNADSPAAQPAPVQALEHEPENEPHVSLASVQGWKLVPVVPTVEMVAAYDQAKYSDDIRIEANNVWASMVNAASPTQQEPAQDWKALAEEQAETIAKMTSEKYPFAHIRIDASEAEKEGALRSKLIELGWAPPAQPAPVREDWGPGPHEVHSLPPAAQPAVPQAPQAARLPADDTEGGAA